MLLEEKIKALVAMLFFFCFKGTVKWPQYFWIKIIFALGQGVFFVVFACFVFCNY